jgi:hypothetical protein
MLKRIRNRCCRLHDARFAARGEFKQCFGSFGRQTISDDQQAVFVRLTHVIQPLGGNTVAEQFIIRLAGEQPGLRRRGSQRQFRLHVNRDDHFLDRLADFHELRRAGLWMRLQLAPLRPVVGLVVVVHVAKEQASLRLVDDQPDVAAGANGPEPLVLRLVELVKSQAGTRWVRLQVEGRCLHGLLLVSAQTREAFGESVGYSKIHSFLSTQDGNSMRTKCYSPPIRDTLNIVRALGSEGILKHRRNTRAIQCINHSINPIGTA